MLGQKGSELADSNNNILSASIVIYCIGIFALMKISLLETILVKYLLEKDSASQDSDPDSDPKMNEETGD